MNPVIEVRQRANNNLMSVDLEKKKDYLNNIFPNDLIKKINEYLDITSQSRLSNTARYLAHVISPIDFSKKFPKQFIEIIKTRDINLNHFVKEKREKFHQFPTAPEFIYFQTGLDPTTRNPYVNFKFVGDRECQVRDHTMNTTYNLNTWKGTIKISMDKGRWVISLNESLPFTNYLLETALKNPNLFKTKKNRLDIIYKFSENDPPNPETEMTKWEALDYFLDLVVFQKHLPPQQNQGCCSIL